MIKIYRLGILLVCAIFLIPHFPAGAQEKFTIEQVLSPAFPFELVSAGKTDRIAWIEFQRGLRNIYTAAAPSFTPVRLTGFLEDNGYDLSSLRISDDGSVIMFVRGHAPNREGWIANPNSEPDGSEQAIWAVRTDGGPPWRVVEAGAPLLSPDGQWVLFQRDGEIYEVSVYRSSDKPFGEEQLKPLFKTFGSNGSLQWSPDSRKIAFVSDRDNHSFIGIYDRAARKIVYLSPGVDLDSGPSWSSDSKRIAFIRRPGAPFSRIVSGSLPGERSTRPERQNIASGAGFQSSAFADGKVLTLWVGDADTGNAHKIWHNPPDSAYFDIRSITWADRNIVFRLEMDNWQHYYAVPVDGTDPDFIPVDLTPGEGFVEQIGFSSDGKYLYSAANMGDIDRRDIWRTETNGRRRTQLTKGDMSETYPAPLASGTNVAILYAGARLPQSVAVIPSGGGDARVISTLPDEFPREEHVVPENIVLTAEDGVTFHNQLFIPKDLRRGERRPAMLFTHGGPRRQMLLGYHYMHFYHMAYAINQYFANKGYIVISVNYRSGIGYGREFRMAEERGSRGSSEYQDVYAAGKYLQSRPDVDPEKIGLWGLSYGGILTAMGLSRNSDIFSAGVDIAGVHLWGNSLDETETSFLSSSVATIDQWMSPVLLIHGDDDRNVAFSQTTGLVQLLRARDIYHELIVFPDEVHDFLVFEKWLTTFNAADDFFDRMLLKK
ncbi:S9 family peptidase [candidate division KSB1 bacterium]